MTDRNQKMRDALKDIEAHITAALAQQPEDEAKCGQFLYDALAKVFNIADTACHEANAAYREAVNHAVAALDPNSGETISGNDAGK